MTHFSSNKNVANSTLVGVLLFAISAGFSSSAFARGFVDFSLGGHNICAIDVDGTLECTTRFDPTVFLPPDNNTRYTAVSSGSAHTCAITSTGGISCFGENNFGQLNVPETDATFVDISASEGHTCAIDTDRSALCWGLNTNGQTDVPADAINLTSIYTSPTASCAINTDGETLCWSDDFRFDTSRASTGYVQLTIEGGAAGAPTCGLTEDGAIDCWGGTQQFTEVPTGGPYTQLASSSIIFCGLRSDGDLDCPATPISNAGFNDRHALASAEAEAFPPVSKVDVSLSVNPVTAICGLGLDDGALYCTSQNLPADTLPGAASSELTAPTNLAYIRYSSTAGELTWNGPQINNVDAAVAGYNIYRDGDFLEFTANGGSFFDDQLVPGFAHVYENAAVDLNGEEGERSDSITISTVNGSAIGGSTTTPGANAGGSTDAFGLPESIQLERYSDTALELFWQRPSTFFAGTTNVYRNGVLIATTGGTSYFDDAVIATEDYHYTIVLFDRTGELTAVAFASALASALASE